MNEHPATNHLKNETSPYLLQHVHNPVDWYPWGPEALERARREEKPIFLSIGYSACHWCHVMEHESFEDRATAAIMNEHFVNIKVDREERPDLDHIYMTAVQMMTRHGGWPMSVFLTPELEPFYGGTYFPPEPRHGMPSFTQVLQGVADAWQNRRGEVLRSAGGLAGAIQQMNQPGAPGEGVPTLQLIDRAIQSLERDFDPGYGGFGSAPKFPHPMDLKLLLRHWKRTGSEQSLEMATRTLDHMARGGIYDQLGGGFHRYSTDERWLVPHFEKMLYDNALLAQVYLEAFQATGSAEYARVAEETLQYVLREMTAPDGGFYSTQDADSEGVEGKFFVWSFDEIQQILGPEAAADFAYIYDVTAEGNWEEQNILNRPKSLDQCAKLLNKEVQQLDRFLQEARGKLFQARSKRIAPGRDDKILVSWNGLMIDAMARGHQVLGGEQFLKAAERAASFILERMWLASGADDGGKRVAGSASERLLHSYKDGRARFNAYLDDYAALIDSLVSLYESTFDPGWIERAVELTEVMIEQYWDEPGGSFYYTPADHERLISRVRDMHDSATPSGNSLAATALLRLGRLTNRPNFIEKGERTLRTFSAVMEQTPRASAQMLIALDFTQHQPVEMVIAAGEKDPDGTDRVLNAIWSAFVPSKVVAKVPAGIDPSEHRRLQSLIPLAADKAAIDGKVTVYVCESYSCRAPVVGVDAAVETLEKLVRSRLG